MATLVNYTCKRFIKFTPELTTDHSSVFIETVNMSESRLLNKFGKSSEAMIFAVMSAIFAIA